jgi:peroxidase
MYVMCVQSGGPGWSVLLGRLDARTSSIADAQNLPGPTDGLAKLKEKFRTATLDDTTDLVALSGNQTNLPNIILKKTSTTSYFIYM